MRSATLGQVSRGRGLFLQARWPRRPVLSDPGSNVFPVTKRPTAKTPREEVATSMATTNPDKTKALDLALAQIDKQFGKGSVMRLGERPVMQMQVIPTGSIALDVALGVGGLPRGRIVEIYGPESSGKTSDRKSTRLNSSH